MTTRFTSALIALFLASTQAAQACPAKDGETSGEVILRCGEPLSSHSFRSQDIGGIVRMEYVYKETIVGFLSGRVWYVLKLEPKERG